VIPPGGAERLEAADLSLDVVGLQVEVHAFFAGLLVVGFLQEDPYLRVWEAEPDGFARAGVPRWH
jgi:hypothetical protein